MPLKTRNTLPPGGWVFDVRAPNGTLIKKIRSMSPFADVVKEIQQIREANLLPNSDPGTIAAELDAAQCERLGFDPRVVDVKKKLVVERHVRNVPRQVVEGVGRALSEFKNYVAGFAVLKEWLGEGGKPVPNDVAENRSLVCLTFHAAGADKPGCPFHLEGRDIPEEIAAKIRLHLEKKNEMQLRVSRESELKSCDICSCFLPLKVHTPIRHLVEQYPAALWDKFREKAPHCWQLQEIEKL